MCMELLLVARASGRMQGDITAEDCVWEPRLIPHLQGIKQVRTARCQDGQEHDMTAVSIMCALFSAGVSAIHGAVGKHL